MSEGKDKKYRTAQVLDFLSFFVRDCRKQLSTLTPNSEEFNVCKQSSELKLGKKVAQSLPNMYASDALCFAVKNDLIELVRALIGLGANVNAPANKPTAALEDYPLQIAVQRGNIEILRVLVESGANVNVKVTGEGKLAGFTPLHLAADRGCEEVIRYLLDFGADAGAKCVQKQHTPFHYALAKGHFKAVSLLATEDGAQSFEWRDKEGFTALHTAVKQGNFDIVDLLVNTMGAHLNARDNNLETPLNLALRNGAQLRIVSCLLKKGADATIPNSGGHTPMHTLAVKGEIRIADLLVRNRGLSLVRALTPQGETPLHLAARSGKAAMARFLVENLRSDIGARDGSGNTPMHCAAASGSVDTVQALLSLGGDAKAVNYKKQSPLHMAACTNWTSPEIIKLLVLNADVHLQDKDGNTPLHLAVIAGKCSALLALVECGANVDVQDNDGKSPLHMATGTYRTTYLTSEIFALLVLNADVHLQDKEGNTPLHLAVMKGNVDQARQLSMAGGYAEIKNNRGETPLSLAEGHAIMEKRHPLVRALRHPV